MDFFGILKMVGGLALFLYGMDLMGDGLAKASGGKMEKMLETLTSNTLKAVALGAIVTAVIQSSSATTVIVVGFVNSGIMKLTQAVGVIMGANIGTTMTSWLLSLTGIESGNFFMNLLKPSSFSPILAIIGVVFLQFLKSDKKKNVGMIMVGFAILMTGMDTMSGAVKPLADVPEFTNILTMFTNPVLGVIAGAVLTAIIQSSSASVGILQALCATGAINFAAAIPIIMGQNIGTCVTALMSSFGATKNAKRASMVHFYFNFIGTVVFMIAFYAVNAIMPFAFLNGPADATGIAIVHSIFNVACAVCWFPFPKVLVKLATLTIPDKANEVEEKNEFAILDERFLEQPAFAMELCRNTAVKMAELCKDTINLSLENMTSYSEEKFKKILEMEETIDRYQDALGSFLVKLGNRDLSRTDSRTLTILLHTIGDFERMGDHAASVAHIAKTMNQKGYKFSENALTEFEIFSQAIREVVSSSVQVFQSGDLEVAKMIEPLEQAINNLVAEMKQRHVKRLRKGKCTVNLGIMWQELLANFGRISDHCSNIAVCLIEIDENELETHNYLLELRTQNAKWYSDAVHSWNDKYKLPNIIIDEEESVTSKNK